MTRETTRDVFTALLATRPEPDERRAWVGRWEAARRAERELRARDERWTASLRDTARYGQ